MKKPHTTTADQIRYGKLSIADQEVLDNLRRQIAIMDRGYPSVSIFLKGLCVPNPGLGKFAAILDFSDHLVTVSDFLFDTTNNECELFAALDALNTLTEPHEVDVYSNSQWLINCKTGTYDRHCYYELWDRLDHLAQPHLIEWHWERSHPLIDQARTIADDLIVPIAPHMIPDF